MSMTDDERSTLVKLELKKAHFHLHYIKTGVLPIEYGRLYNQLQTMREESDYNCVYDVNADELKDRIEPAQKLIEKIEELISK